MAHGLLINDASGNPILDTSARRTIQFRETVLIDLVPGNRTYPDLAGRQIDAVVTLNAGYASSYTAITMTIDYSLGYPRVAWSSMAGTPGYWFGYLFVMVKA